MAADTSTADAGQAPGPVSGPSRHGFQDADAVLPQYHIEAQTSLVERPLRALKFGEAGPTELSALTAAGIALFAITLIVNFGASAVVARSRSGAGTEI